MRRTTPGELDGTNGGNLTVSKIGILGFEIHDQLTHGDRKRAVMIFSLRSRWSEEANDAMRVKGISCAAQAPFRQVRLLCPFCRSNSEKYDRANAFIQALLWSSTPLLEQMVVVRSLPAFSLSLWRTRNSCALTGKGDAHEGILCLLDNLWRYATGKARSRQEFVQNIGRFSPSPGLAGALVSVTLI